jgi:hypothetical protein
MFRQICTSFSISSMQASADMLQRCTAVPVRDTLLLLNSCMQRLVLYWSLSTPPPPSAQDGLAEKLGAGEVPVKIRSAPFVQIPLGVTEDRLVGTVDIEASMKVRGRGGGGGAGGSRGEGAWWSRGLAVRGGSRDT